MSTLLSAQPAAAQSVYQYQGKPFTLFSCGPSIDPTTGVVTGTMLCSTPAPTNANSSYTVTNRVSATLTLGSALPANLALQDISALPGFQLSMNDGQHTVTNAMAVGMFAEVSTDGAGRIVLWRLVLNTGGVANGGIATINNGSSIFDAGTLACCDPTVQGNLAFAFSAAGTWSSGAASPATAVTNLINQVRNPLLGLAHGQVQSLTDKLSNVLASINAGLNRQATHQLNAFIQSVRSSQQTGKMSSQTATTLIAAANAIIALL